MEEAAAKLIKVVETTEQDPELVAKYEKKYQVFRQIYPALKPIYNEIVK